MRATMTQGLCLGPQRRRVVCRAAKRVHTKQECGQQASGAALSVATTRHRRCTDGGGGDEVWYFDLGKLKCASRLQLLGGTRKDEFCVGFQAGRGCNDGSGDRVMDGRIGGGKRIGTGEQKS
ncbi:hypothetical protein HBI56_201670 [Parastagonospora nodorum]|uniref:Uncharacterized protein n=1 Tax=Phaeosphaeria nodorum (strain SN15 / ATCC MYA-4574 / FGSC 10173) TaxID=321614 RepID=A0A7U2EVZ3_PHANO|nr:hypothetical protein HBH56_216200 [Parastagonospora nodorum]QRC93917.1 hypothetical protein JI435_404780 [Parastagonospora nodorum SN15]KAH3961240.1 hypothetical protein HBH51_184880 [Parastagonospora nodorum]KAH3963194.1 hypothetical protein HBH52_220190 [Parastagonospora nodorum]KAH3992651.1 hypothetical protein HBI10_215730 [Parastagonospora nodorum]